MTAIASERQCLHAAHSSQIKFTIFVLWRWPFDRNAPTNFGFSKKPLQLYVYGLIERRAVGWAWSRQPYNRHSAMTVASSIVNSMERVSANRWMETGVMWFSAARNEISKVVSTTAFTSNNIENATARTHTHRCTVDERLCAVQFRLTRSPTENYDPRTNGLCQANENENNIARPRASSPPPIRRTNNSRKYSYNVRKHITSVDCILCAVAETIAAEKRRA